MKLTSSVRSHHFPANVCFLFQAEDGIRDIGVTGVQTCALPILTVTFIDRILDVTDYVNEQLKKDEDPEGTNYLSQTYLNTVAHRFAKAENIEVTPATKLELKAFYGGNKYYLFVKRSEEHTSELQSRQYLVCRLLLEKKKQ